MSIQPIHFLNFLFPLVFQKKFIKKEHKMSSAKFDELIKKVRGQNNTYHSFDLQSFLLLSLLAALLVFYLLLKFFTKHPSSSPHSPLPSPPPLLFPRIIPTNTIHSPPHFHVHFPPLQPFPFTRFFFSISSNFHFTTKDQTPRQR